MGIDTIGETRWRTQITGKKEYSAGNQTRLREKFGKEIGSHPQTIARGKLCALTLK